MVLVQNAICGSKHDPQPEVATVVVLRAFADHDVVMVGEIHSNTEEYNWYVSLLRTPEFADRVDDIVLEMGNSLYQQFVDSYVSGDNLPFESNWERKRCHCVRRRMPLLLSTCLLCPN